MSTATNTAEELVNREYKYGFVTEIEADTVPRGLNEDIIRLISAKKNEPNFMLDWRMKAYQHWVKLAKSQVEPKGANIHYPPIDLWFFRSAGPRFEQEVSNPGDLELQTSCGARRMAAPTAARIFPI
jgi:hypothetical protein